ncbi:MAG: hypothetical protein ABIV13_05605 [Fimbriimonadales bacterium]
MEIYQPIGRALGASHFMTYAGCLGVVAGLAAVGVGCKSLEGGDPTVTAGLKIIAVVAVALVVYLLLHNVSKGKGGGGCGSRCGGGGCEGGCGGSCGGGCSSQEPIASA